MKRPPRGPAWLLERLLPGRLSEPIVGDLEEDWQRSRASRWRFWTLALRSLAACWMDVVRARVTAERPTTRARGDRLMRSVLQDIQYGWRQMRRNPGFTAAAALTLALGIGVNAVMFGIVQVLALKPLPYSEPERVAFVLGWDVERGEMRFSMRAADYLDLRGRATSLEALAAYAPLSANLSGGDTPERVQAYRVSPTTFPLLGVEAALGRTLDQMDVRAGRDVAVLSHGLWRRAFGGDPGVIGRRIVLDGLPHEIVGVMPASFEFPVFNFKGDLWIPWRIDGARRGQADGRQGATIIARLKKEVPYSQAQAEVSAIMAALAQEHPASNRGLGARVIQMGRLDDEQAGAAMPLVMAMAALVLGLACANVAHLLMARGLSRHRELAVRGAIGATRARIARQLFIESLLLGGAGGALGVLVAAIVLPLLRAALPEFLRSTVPNVETLTVDAITLIFAVAVTLVASVGFGLLPAIRGSRGRLLDGLGESAGIAGGRSTHRLRAVLVVAEVALAALLLIVAGLLVRSFIEVRRIDPGFDSRGVLTLAVTLPDDRYPDASHRRQFVEQALARIQALGSVLAAGAVNVLPFSTSDRGARLSVEGAGPLEPGREPFVGYRVATPAYHAALAIPLVEGRYLDERDAPPAAPVALVNATLARRHFEGHSPLGRRVRLGPEEPWLTIVGVVGDVRHSAITDAPAPEIYVPFAHAPGATMMLAVRAGADPDGLAAAVRAEIRRLDEAQPVYHVRTLERLVRDSVLPQRFSTLSVAFFGTLALALAAVGISGVVAQAVQLRTRELGLRMALGATPRDVMALVVRSAAAMLAGGLALGFAGAFALSGAVRGLLYGITPSDPWTYAAAGGALSVVGVLACGIPAMRAARADPAIALKAH